MYVDEDVIRQHSRAEWAAWRGLMTRLQASGAITKSDLDSSPDELNTSGQELLGAVRDWGERISELRIANGE